MELLLIAKAFCQAVASRSSIIYPDIIAAEQ